MTVNGPRVEKSVLTLLGTRGFCTPAMAQQAQWAVKLQADPAVALAAKQLSSEAWAGDIISQMQSWNQACQKFSDSLEAPLDQASQSRRKGCPCHYCDLVFISSVWSSPGHPN